MCDQAVQTTRLNFLNAALTDMSACIRFMDTKVATIIAADMLLLTTLITSNNINKIINLFKALISLICGFIRSFNCHDFINSIILIILIAFSIVFAIVFAIALTRFVRNTMRVYRVGISTLFARFGSKGTSNRSTRFVTDDGYNKEEYLSDFEGKTTEALIKEMTEELYELNMINIAKMENVNTTLKAFRLSLFYLFVMIVLFVLFDIAEASWPVVRETILR